MIIDQALCSALSQAELDHESYVQQAIRVDVGPLVSPLPGSAASGVIRFEIIHRDDVCQRVLADACVLVVSQDDDIRFVAPETAAADNYVSYWHLEAEPRAGQPGWAVLAPGQSSRTNQVRLLGQTLPAEVAPEGGAGYLHYQPARPDDGWTVSVGVYSPGGFEALAGQTFNVSVSARPDWNPSTAPQPVKLP